MNKYKIQIIAPCQDFLDDLKEYNLPVHTQLCDTIEKLFPTYLTVNSRD